MYNGVLAYAMNLEKKLKRRKGAVIIEEYTGSEPTEAILQEMLNKHNNITKTVSETTDKPLKYHWINLKTKCSTHSIYPDLKWKEENDWIPFTYKDNNTIIVEKLPDTESILGRKIDKIETSQNGLIVTLI